MKSEKLNTASHKVFLEALLSGNKAECMNQTKSFLDKNDSIKDLYENLYRVTLYNVGDLWEDNKISVAKEHLATATVESVMNSLYERIVTADKNQHKVVVSCAENEQHQVGAKMVADVFEMNGWNSIFLGASTPRRELMIFLEEEQPDVLCLSLSLYLHMRQFMRLVKHINQSFPSLTVLMGGQAFRHAVPREMLAGPNNFVIPDLESLNSFIINYRSSK